MGNACSWLSRYMFPEEQVVWHAAHRGDVVALRSALAALTPTTRRYIEWQDPCSGRSPMAEAALKGHTVCVVALVEAGANVNAKDYKGNTILHQACKEGRIEVVRYLIQVPALMPFDFNLAMMTPLDLVRDKLTRREDEDTTRFVHYEQCIEELEKKFYVYSGWLYEKTSNVLSLVSGISNLDSWKRRFCIVLQRGIPDVLELALFPMKPGNARPACPCTVVLYHVRGGMYEITDSKWFNRKEFTFAITGTVRRDGGQDPRLATSAEKIEFAAVDDAGFQMWRSFFSHQQATLAERHPSAFVGGHTGMAAPIAPHMMPPHVTAVPFGKADCGTDCGRVPSSRSTSDSSIASTARSSIVTARSSRVDLDDTVEEDPDLRRAIELSLRDQRPSQYVPAPAVSAPDWESDDDCSSRTSTSSGPAPQAKSDVRPPLVVSYSSSAPSSSHIGECVVCFDGPQAAVCVPCGHNAVCMQCAEEIVETSGECPVCRQPIRELIKLYRV